MEEPQYPEMIERCPGQANKYMVRLRQKLKTEHICMAFNQQLTDKIEEERSQGKLLIVEDFDISQNIIPSEQLELLLATLADGGVHVERFRAFGVPTLNDHQANFLAGWLSGVTDDTAPFELHLSDCAITTEGFQALVQ